MPNLIHPCVASVLALSLFLSGVSVVSADSEAGSARQASCCNRCPQCHATCCELKVEQVDEDKYCWKVECETICIPRVVFPWQKNCCDPSANNGARVKTVRVLKKHEYTCPKCEYAWTPVDHGCVGVGHYNGGCVTCDAMPIEGETSVEEPATAPLPPPANRSSLGADKPRSVETSKVSVVAFLSRILGGSK